VKRLRLFKCYYLVVESNSYNTKSIINDLLNHQKRSKKLKFELFNIGSMNWLLIVAINKKPTFKFLAKLNLYSDNKFIPFKY